VRPDLFAISTSYPSLPPAPVAYSVATTSCESLQRDVTTRFELAPASLIIIVGISARKIALIASTADPSRSRVPITDEFARAGRRFPRRRSEFYSAPGSSRQVTGKVASVWQQIVCLAPSTRTSMAQPNRQWLVAELMRRARELNPHSIIARSSPPVIWHAVACNVKHNFASTRLGKHDIERRSVDPSLMRLTEEGC
jgi:hypothetical protein